MYSRAIYLTYMALKSTIVMQWTFSEEKRDQKMKRKHV